MSDFVINISFFLPSPSSVDELGALMGDETIESLCWWALRICASYSLPARRMNSRRKTRIMTPIHDPANIAVEVTRHEWETKQASTVYQFHNICEHC